MTLNDLLNDHQTGQDDVQLNQFVLGGRTQWGTYKQALRELYKRVRGLRQMQTDLDLLLIDIEELERQITTEVGYEKRRAEIQLRQKFGALEEANRSLLDLKREAAIFYRAAAELKMELGDITDERRTELDKHEWMHWLVKQGQLGKLTTGRLPEVVLKNAYAMPEVDRRQLLQALSSSAEHFIEQGEYGMQALPPPTEEDIQLLEQEIRDDNLITG